MTQNSIRRLLIMKLVTLHIPEQYVEGLERLVENNLYPNRSEAIRDMIRKNLITEQSKDPDAKAIATLTMIYDHHTGILTNKLLDLQHDHHNEILSTTHIHIDHHNCLEVLVLKGKTRNIQKLADNIKALKGIKHGELVITQSSH